MTENLIHAIFVTSGLLSLFLPDDLPIVGVIGSIIFWFIFQMFFHVLVGHEVVL